MLTEQHQKLVDWANNSWPNVTKITPIRLILKNQTWEGVRYLDWINVGKNNPGIPRKDYSYYILGELPKIYRKSNKICFVMPDSNFEYYIAGYYQESDKAFEAYHPCGKNWLLMPWTSNEPIDLYSQKEYTRFNLGIDLLFADCANTIAHVGTS